MKFTLKDYQRDAVLDALANLKKARRLWQSEGDKTAFSLTAVPGAGKTVMAAAAFAALLQFHLQHIAGVLSRNPLQQRGQRQDLAGLHRGAGLVVVVVGRRQRGQAPQGQAQ